MPPRAGTLGTNASPSCVSDLFLLDHVAQYSATPLKASELITRASILFMSSIPTSVLDLFGGAGVDAIVFACHGARRVDVIEKSKTRARNIALNVTLMEDATQRGTVHVWNGDSTTFIFEDALPDNDAGLLRSTYDVVYLDPPWGGPGYKRHDTYTISVGAYTVPDIIEGIVARGLVSKLIVVKLPYNHDMSHSVFHRATVFDVMRVGRTRPLFKMAYICAAGSTNNKRVLASLSSLRNRGFYMSLVSVGSRRATHASP